MSRFISRRFDVLKAYVPGEQPQDKKYVKLNTNESPYPPSPEVSARLNAAEAAKLKLYSDPDCRGVRERLAALYGVKAENVLVTNGSDEALNFALWHTPTVGLCFRISATASIRCSPGCTGLTRGFFR